MKYFPPYGVSLMLDIVGNEEILKSCKNSSKTIEDIIFRKLGFSWPFLAELFSLKACPEHTTHFVDSMYDDAVLYEYCRHILPL